MESGDGNVTKVSGTVLMEIMEGSGLKEFTDQVNLQGYWFSMENVLSILKLLPFETILNIGETVPKHASFPSNISTFDQAIETLNDAYHMNHINGIGNYVLTRPTQLIYLIDCRTVPYPIPFNLGLFQGLGKKFGVSLEVLVQQICGGGVFEVQVKPMAATYSV